MKPGIIIIIPVYNEEKNIEAVINGISSQVMGADIVVINDGSNDRTREILQQLKVKTITHPFNLGYGAALQTGFKYALLNDYDFAVQIDGDGQHEPADINNLLQVVFSQEADVALGSRFLSGKSYDMSFSRKTGIKIFSFIASILTGQKITDSTSGFQAINRRAIKNLYATDYFPVDYPDADVIIMLSKTGMAIKEVPVKMYSTPDKNSMHGGGKSFYYIFKMFLSIILTIMRKN
jgi:glycosyltransferase involved in cell wall biosynthesis